MKNLKSRKVVKAIFSISILLSLTLVGCSGNKEKNTSANNETASVQKNDVEKNTSSEQTKEKVQEEKTQAKNTNTKNTSAIKFSKEQLGKSVNTQFSTPWETSSKETYKACIEGKGEEASEEGTGKILVKNNNGNNFSFEIINNNKLSPRNIEWVDDENLLVVVGSSQGTVSKGGNLYMLNINTGNTLSIIETSDKKQQIMSSKKVDNNVNLKVTVYEDDNYNKSHVENWTIYSFDSSLNKSMEVKNSEGKVIYTIK
ncbi:DUF4652 domain-containing protein [Clostridium sp. P21]|uniref:DUF4652 domain-containing protein n=1 Tax=Clostridium muellerianum TaxID=2716538 RepID=A0A7Y0EF16_9CLOT|nr:DUF4652 domain-containing protein [Clostridium muellerianum]NMM62183.1 DUF4652 domain-containing protein [Clostridium muellerianum]